MRVFAFIWIVSLTISSAFVPAAFAAKIQEVVSPGGIKAWFVEEKTIPIVSMEVVWKGGASTVSAEKAGLAHLMASTMDEGAADLDSKAFQKKMSDLAISLSFDAAKDTFGGSLKTLSVNKEEAFRLFSLAISAPRFDTDPVERIRNQILVGLNRKLANPNSLAGRAWFEAAFKGHAYANPTMGSLATMKALTTADLRQFKDKQIAQDNMVISVIGDIRVEELGRLLDQTFMGIPKKSDLKFPVDVDRVNGPSLEIIPQDIPQSVVIYGGNGVKRDDPEYYAAYVLNYILGGGGFESRLTKEIREKRGLVYSVYSYLSPFQRVGLQLGGFGTSNASVTEAIKLVKSELVKIRTKGVTAEELDAAKKYLNGSFPLRLSSNSRIANIMVSMQLFDLPVSYLDERPKHINAVSLADVKKVANRLMDPDELIITIVGKPEGMTPEN